MTEREALKLALEALEYEAEKGNDDAYRVEREAIKEALAQPVIDKSAATRIATSLGWEPKRTWVGLTDEEWEMTHWSPDFRAGAKWAEAKLRSKNT